MVGHSSWYQQIVEELLDGGKTPLIWCQKRNTGNSNREGKKFFLQFVIKIRVFVWLVFISYLRGRRTYTEKELVCAG